MKISKEQILKMERSVRRKLDIENQAPRVRYAVHKSKRQYNRQQNKQAAKI